MFRAWTLCRCFDLYIVPCQLKLRRDSMTEKDPQNEIDEVDDTIKCVEAAVALQPVKIPGWSHKHLVNLVTTLSDFGHVMPSLHTVLITKVYVLNLALEPATFKVRLCDVSTASDSMSRRRRSSQMGSETSDVSSLPGAGRTFRISCLSSLPRTLAADVFSAVVLEVHRRGRRC